VPSLSHTARARIEEIEEKGEVKREDEIRDELLQKLAEQILTRSMFASDTYLNTVTGICSMVTPIYVVTLRFILDNKPVHIISLDFLPAWLLLTGFLIISIARFPQSTTFDLKQPLQIFQAQEARAHRLRAWAIIATIVVTIGFIDAIFVIANVNSNI
jgi:hypothetical protein